MPVTLLGRMTGQHTFVALADTVTGSDGGYSFAQAPTRNMVYVVRETLKASVHTAELFVGVHDTITASASSPSGSSGSQVTVSGTVLPGKAGGVVLLQRLGKDGDWHTVNIAFLNGASAYSVTATLGDPGTETFRTRVLGDRVNLGGVSASVTFTVGPAVQSSLPAAS